MPAISRLVRRSVTSSAIWSSRLRQRGDAGVLAGRGPARLGAGAELAQLAPHLVAHAHRAAGVELASRPGAASRWPACARRAAASARPARALAKAAGSRAPAARSRPARPPPPARRPPWARPAASRTRRARRAGRARSGGRRPSCRRAPRRVARSPRAPSMRPTRELGEREDLPVEAVLHGDLVEQVVAAEGVHASPMRAATSPASKRAMASDPAGPAAAGRHRAAGQPAARRGALSSPASIAASRSPAW